jgi:hypothetical protein
VSLGFAFPSLPCLSNRTASLLASRYLSTNGTYSRNLRRCSVGGLSRNEGQDDTMRFRHWERCWGRRKLDVFLSEDTASLLDYHENQSIRMAVRHLVQRANLSVRASMPESLSTDQRNQPARRTESQVTELRPFEYAGYVYWRYMITSFRAYRSVYWEHLS